MVMVRGVQMVAESNVKIPVSSGKSGRKEGFDNMDKWWELRHWLQELLMNTEGPSYSIVIETLEKMQRLDEGDTR